MSTGTLDTSDTTVVSPTAGRARDPRLVTAITVTAIVAGVLLLRLIGLGSAYDIYIDEPFYLSLVQSINAGHFVPIGSGTEFLLHPPGFFWLSALWSQVFGFTGDPFHNIIVLRAFEQVFAAATAVLIYFIVRRLAGQRTAVVAAAMFALDAYLLQQNARVMLETPAMTFVLAGYLALLRIIQDGPIRRHLNVVLAGAGFGAALLTKDMTILITVVPLLAIAAVNWWKVRVPALTIAGIAAGMYLAYVAMLLGTGHYAAFWAAKTSGLSRLAGKTITTGFNSEASGSLGHALISQTLFFAGSYLLVAVGTLAGLWLLLKPHQDHERLLGVFTASATLLTAYNLVFGTIEEQFLAFLMIPALMSAAVAGTRLVRTARNPQQAGLIASLALIVFGLLSVVSWVHIHKADDTAQRQAYTWMRANLEPGTKVAWTGGQTEMILRGSTINAVEVGKPADMAAQGVTYLVVLDKTVRQGYANVPQSQIDWYAAHATTVFTATGRSQGQVTIYRTTDASAW